jgi:hypothetical protein
MGGHYTNLKNLARGSVAARTELVGAKGNQVEAKTANERPRKDARGLLANAKAHCWTFIYSGRSLKPNWRRHKNINRSPVVLEQAIPAPTNAPCFTDLAVQKYKIAETRIERRVDSQDLSGHRWGW